MGYNAVNQCSTVCIASRSRGVELFRLLVNDTGQGVRVLLIAVDVKDEAMANPSPKAGVDVVKYY